VSGADRAGSVHARHWTLDPDWVFLNHGSFGACPRAVLEEQSEWRARFEAQPVRFVVRELEAALDAARADLARFVGADPDDLVLVPNATTGVNWVLRGMELAPGDEIVLSNHEYNATANAVRFVAERAGAIVREVCVPFPIASEDDVVERVAAAFTDRTRLLVCDHVTSMTGLVLPIARLVALARERGVETLVDGAHAPGMLPLDLQALGAGWYTGNCHKWLCTPKGSAFLHVRRDLQEATPPLITSHGRNASRTDRSRFRLEADWTGTCDPSPWLCIPRAIDVLGGLFDSPDGDGFDALRAHNKGLVLGARERLCAVLGVDVPAPESMIGSIATVPLPDVADDEPAPSEPWLDPLYDRFGARRIEVVVGPWPAPPCRVLRVSGQAYNAPGQYEVLAHELAAWLREH
jgi:isopenicillin-N epimerase